MNGWQRLGVVVSTLLAIPAGLIGYDANDNLYVRHTPSDVALELEGQDFIDIAYSEALAVHPELKDCILADTRVTRLAYSDDVSISCDKRIGAVFDVALMWFLLPFAVVFGFGYLVRWIYRGFRPLEPTKT